MTSSFDPEKHRETMRNVRSTNGKHEVMLRQFLELAGYVDAHENSGLPFRPDIVLLKERTAIFMHGCYWHRHDRCRFSYDVGRHAKNPDDWRKKFADNQARDKRQQEELLAMGWRVLVVWQCALNAKKRADVFLPQVLEWLSGAKLDGEVPEVPPVQKQSVMIS